MTDLEITRSCAEAMGLNVFLRDGVLWLQNQAGFYNPLHEDAQAMALVRKFGLDIKRYPENDG